MHRQNNTNHKVKRRRGRPPKSSKKQQQQSQQFVKPKKELTQEQFLRTIRHLYQFLPAEMKDILTEEDLAEFMRFIFRIEF